LRLAIGIAMALGKLHEGGLVHKDIKPVNILVNGATGGARLTGFDIASRLSRERQAAESPDDCGVLGRWGLVKELKRMLRSLALRPPKLSRRSTDHVAKMTRQMALVRKAGRIRNFR
jgi:serine/threonine protein kinase